MAGDAAHLVLHSPNMFRPLHQPPAPLKPGVVVVSTCNLGTREAEAGESGVQDYPWLHSDFRPAKDTS